MTRMTTVQAGVMQIARLSSQLEVKNYGFVGTGQNPPYLCIVNQNKRRKPQLIQTTLFDLLVQTKNKGNETQHPPGAYHISSRPD